MSQHVKLCDYTNEPAARLEEINRLCLVPYGLENVFSTDDLSNVTGHYTEKGGVFLLVKKDDQIIGFGALENLYEGVLGALTRLRILPEYQGQGIGKSLIQELLNRAKIMGYKRLVLDTTTAQDAAGLYEKFGFTEFSRKTGAAGFTDIYYELKLA